MLHVTFYKKLPPLRHKGSGSQHGLSEQITSSTFTFHSSLFTLHFSLFTFHFFTSEAQSASA